MSDLVEKIKKDLGLTGDWKAGQSPLAKSMENSLSKPEQRGILVFSLMKKMIDSGKKPSWDDFSSTVGWHEMAMNLTTEIQAEFEKTWRQTYKDLMDPTK